MECKVWCGCMRAVSNHMGMLQNAMYGCLYTKAYFQILVFETLEFDVFGFDLAKALMTLTFSEADSWSIPKQLFKSMLLA